MKIELTRLTPKSQHARIDTDLTDKFKDREHLISTLNAMKRRKPVNKKTNEKISEITLRLRQGYPWKFRSGKLSCYHTTVKMY